MVPRVTLVLCPAPALFPILVALLKQGKGAEVARPGTGVSWDSTLPSMQHQQGHGPTAAATLCPWTAVQSAPSWSSPHLLWLPPPGCLSSPHISSSWSMGLLLEAK